MKFRTVLCLLSLAIGSIASAANLVTPADSAEVTIPNSAVATTSNGLVAGKTYRVDLEQKTGTNPDTYSSLGSTETFDGPGTHHENVDVDHNPGPGEHDGRARLMVYNNNGGGSWTEADSNDVTWNGPAMGP